MVIMPVSVLWFLLLLAIAAAFLIAGRGLGSIGPRAAHITLVIALILIAGSAAVSRLNPVLLHTTLPLGVSIYLEGVLAAFPWMLLVGVLWTGDFSRRLRRAVPLMIVLGLVYFLFGGVWMILPNLRPQRAERRTDQGHLTLQSRSDTCAAAACAMAVRRLGIGTTESEMCIVVQAKPTRGSTLARAAYGLQHHLDSDDIAVELRRMDLDEVLYKARPDAPILVTIRSNPAADHMVVVLERLGDCVLIANPSPDPGAEIAPEPIDLPFGYELFTKENFERLYRGAAIVFERREPGGKREASREKATKLDADTRNG
jgi:hypothetical protein